MAAGPNPVKAIQDHLPEHVRDLEEQLVKAIAKVQDIQHELVVAKTLAAVGTPGEQR